MYIGLILDVQYTHYTNVLYIYSHVSFFNTLWFSKFLWDKRNAGSVTHFSIRGINMVPTQDGQEHNRITKDWINTT